LLSALRHVSPARTPAIARTMLAVLLVLVLLAGVAPLSSLASSHECSMACCVGKPSHLAGSCSVSLGDEEQAEPPAEPDGEYSAHEGHAMHLSGATSATNASARHHGATKHSSAHHSTSGVKSSGRASAASQATMTTPCSPECAAAALGSSQVRRPRDPASPVVARRLRPSTRRLFVQQLTVPAPKSVEARRLSRPRAPPSLLNNLSA
jgi:hypothetical protein